MADGAHFLPVPCVLRCVRRRYGTRTKPGRPATEPIEVTVDEEGKVTVIIDFKNGKRGELELPFNLAKDLLMKLSSRLESFENRRGWR